MLAIDEWGNELVAFIPVDEEKACISYKPITVCLLVVKVEEDYLFGFNHWRKCWEIFGGCPEEGETLRQTMMRECKEEIGIERELEWLGVAKFYLQPDYFSPIAREEFGAIYGVTIEKEDLEIIERCRTDKEEIEKIDLLKNISHNVRALDKKLTEFMI